MATPDNSWRQQLNQLDGLPLLAIKGKQPFDAITESPNGWTTAKFPSHVIADCTWSTGVGTRTGADASGLIAFDLDGNTAQDFAREHGCDPDLPDTWAVRRSDNTDRLKKLFQASPEQAAQLGQCRRKRNTKDPVTDDDGNVIKGEAVEIYHGVGQVLLLGNHEDGGQYVWLDGEGPDNCQPLPDNWFRLALLIKEANTSKATTSSKAPRIGVNGWGKIRGTCPICGRNSHPICGTNAAGDRVSCYDGVSFSWDKEHPGIKVGQTVRGRDGKEWALTAISRNDVIDADFASFKIHEPLTPDKRRSKAATRHGVTPAPATAAQHGPPGGNGAGTGSAVPLQNDSPPAVAAEGTTDPDPWAPPSAPSAAQEQAARVSARGGGVESWRTLEIRVGLFDEDHRDCPDRSEALEYLLGDVAEWINAAEHPERAREQAQELFHDNELLTPSQFDAAIESHLADAAAAAEPHQQPQDAAPDELATYAKGEEPIDLRAAQILQDEAAHTIACHQDAFFTYDPAAGYWSRVSADAMKRRALDVLKRIHVKVKIGTGDSATEADSFRFGSARHVDDTIRALRTVAGAGPLERTSPPHVVVFTDGTYNLRTRTLEPHSPDHGATYAVAGPFVPAAVCPPEVLRIITTCFPDEAELILRALFRWIVDPTIRYGEAFHLLGGTGTGKGLILTLAQHLLPSTLVSTLSHPADLKGPEQLYQFALGRRLLLFPDCPAKMPRYAEHLGPWYELVENKPQSLRRLHGSDTDACRLHCRSIIASVSPLKLSDSRDGAQRRMLTVESLPRSGDPDPTLHEDISGNTNRQRQMLGALASWALLMPLDDVNDVLAKDDPGGLLRATAAAVAVEADTVGQWIDACLVPAENKAKPSKDGSGYEVAPEAEVTDADWQQMFESYLGWCKAVNVSYGMQFSNFIGQVRRTLGVARCLPRRKESRDAARAAGRKRRDLPRLDAGFALRDGLLGSTGEGDRISFDRKRMGSGGLATIAALPPLETLIALRQLADSPASTPLDSPASTPQVPRATTDDGPVSQGSDAVDAGWTQGWTQGGPRAVPIADSACSAAEASQSEGVVAGLDALLSHKEQKKGSMEPVSPTGINTSAPSPATTLQVPADGRVDGALSTTAFHRDPPPGVLPSDPPWLDLVLALRATNPTWLPSQIGNALYADHGMDVTNQKIRDALAAFDARQRAATADVSCCLQMQGLVAPTRVMRQGKRQRWRARLIHTSPSSRGWRS